MSAKFRMASNGETTCMELCGKSIGTGVSAVKFSQNGCGEGYLELSIDLEDFSFMPDGYFDMFEKQLAEAKPPEDCLVGRKG